jgi:serine protease
LSGTNVAFSWNPGNIATHFEFYMGTTLGSSNLYNSGNVTATTATVGDLPKNGATVYARLYSLINGAWQYTDYTYKSSGSPIPASLTTPTPNTSTPLSGTSVTFTWNPGNTATHFEFLVGTSVGTSNLYSSGNVTATSATVNDLPNNGETVYARLYTLMNGSWQYLDYTYKASGAPTLAAITAPALNSQFTDTTETFTWNPGNTATHFELYLGTSAGSSNLYNSGSVTVTTETVNGLPSNGEKIYARLYSLINGAWKYTDYTYTAF